MREWINSELIAELSKLPADAKVRLEDADTNWTIPKFTVTYANGEGQNEVWFHTCDYRDMK